MNLLSINNEGITSLEEFFQTHYIGIQNEIQILDCSYNELTDLQGCPPNVKRLFCSNNQLRSLKGIPDGLEQLYCENNQLESLRDCPTTIKIISASDNPLEPEWKGLTGEQLVQKVEIVRIRHGIEIVNRVTGWKWRLVRRFCDLLLDNWYTPDEKGVAPYAMWTWKKFQQECFN